MKRYLALLILINANLGFAKDLIITSTPEKAEIKIYALSGAEKRKAGETPFKSPMIELAASYANGNDLFIVEVTKDGFEPYRIVLSQILKSDITLDVVLMRRTELDDIKKIDKTVVNLFEIQRLIRSRNYDAASKKIEEVEKDFPLISATKELHASSYYLQKDYKKALDYYQQAYVANSDNLDAYKMMIYLEKAMGIKNAKDEK